MFRSRKTEIIAVLGGVSLLCAGLIGAPLIAFGFQDDDAQPAKKAPVEQEVVIKREALKITDPAVYKATMHLDPARSLELTAPTDGVVRTVSAKPGQKVKQQAEAIRLDDSRAALVLKRAKANLQAAQLEKKLAQAKANADEVALAEARLEAAGAEVDLAQLEADQLIVRAPFNGEFQRVHVVEGQFVRAGERLATLVDPSRLQVEVPAERAAATQGNTIDIRVEETAVKAKVESVLPLSARFDPLRELAGSPTSVVVSVDNSSGKLQAGQTVYSELIPDAPVVLVPSITISNVPDGTRKVQVLRDNVVRDIIVKVLAKIGTDSVYVTGRFASGDEVVLSSSRELTDGTPLRALLATAGAGGTKTGAPAKGAAGSSKKPVTGF